MKKLTILLLFAFGLGQDYSLNFQNTNYVLLPDEFEIIGTDGVTISFWMNSNFPENHENYIIDKIRS